MEYVFTVVTYCSSSNFHTLQCVSIKQKNIQILFFILLMKFFYFSVATFAKSLNANIWSFSPSLHIVRCQNKIRKQNGPVQYSGGWVLLCSLQVKWEIIRLSPLSYCPPPQKKIKKKLDHFMSQETGSWSAQPVIHTWFIKIEICTDFD